MIRTADSLNSLTHEAAYMRGFMDGAGGDGKTARLAEEAYRDLTVLLDRFEGIAPWPENEVFDVEEE